MELVGEAPYFVSFQAAAFREDAVERGSSAAPITPVAVELAADAIRAKPSERFREAKQAVDLTQAELIVSVGRGIKAPENVDLAQKLADALGAELGASRPICDNGWLPMDRQIGSSGQTVAPKLYVALGISGAIQHMVGMKGSNTVVAINKDKEAPIFEVATYGIVGNLFEIVPPLIEEIKKVKAT
jgi:electron transfer flavoprotein alpha subunit